MADALADLGSPVDDRILVLNILRGLNSRFKHLGAIIRCYTPFPSFLNVRDDLILEELHLDNSDPPADATTLYTCPAPAAARPPAPHRHLRPARQAMAAPARRARTRRTPVAVGVVVVTPATPLLPLRHRRQGSRLLTDLRQPMAGAHRHVPRSTSERLPAPAGSDGRTRLLPSSGIHTRAAAGGPIPARGTSQLVTMDWFGLGPAIAGAYSTTHYPGLGG
jgi:hypothetical protein